MQVRTWEQLSVKDQADVIKSEFAKLGLNVAIEATSYGSVSEMVISKDGHEIRFASGPTVHRKKAPTVKRYFVTGKLHGVAVNESFAEDSLAEERRMALNSVSAPGEHFTVNAKDVEVNTLN